MTDHLEEKARNMAAEPYSIEMMKDVTTDGEAEVYLLRHPELEGCMAQGESIEEAMTELHPARYEYILSLLEDGLPVPAPVAKQTLTGDESLVLENEYTPKGEPDVMADLEKAVQPETRDRLGIVEPEESIRLVA